MEAPKHIPTEHKDIIHDVSFDYYGKRMATCSSDHTVKIWDLTENGQWKCTADWKTHSGSVWKVTWAHPEFGQVIATCSFDRTAVVWEEQVGEISFPLQSKSKWVQRASLVDSSNSVTDIKFAPKDLGLLLAMCYKDGVFRIYEATDVMNLSHWSVQHVVECKLASASCISWNPSRSIAPMLAVGSDDPSTNVGGKVEIHVLNTNTRKWGKIATLMGVTDAVHDISFAPNVGRSRHLLAIASKEIFIVAIKPIRTPPENTATQAITDKPDIQILATLSDQDSQDRFNSTTQVWRVEWNITGTILASTGDDGRVRLWKGNYMDTWKCLPSWRGDGTTTSILTRPASNSMSQAQNILDMSTQKSYPMY
ncbi:nucleoporin SEH1-like [Clytia hemisphaerica]|uniref:Nucleoporin SEH1 n=1 Tax=Clytia hemisphaerica TaxID=252671 RepID=A0A7M5WT69_9CNID